MVDNIKHSVYDLFMDPDGTIISSDSPLNKETFVLSEKDVLFLNNNFNNQIAQIENDEWSSVESGHYNSDGDTNNTEISSKDSNTQDSEIDLDETMFMYNPPLEYKNKFLLKIFKFSPLLLLFLIPFMLFQYPLNNDPILKRNSDNSNSILNHKIYLLQEDVNNLNNKLDSISRNTIDDSKLVNLESKIKSLSEMIHDLNINYKDQLSNLETRLSNKKQNSEMQEQEQEPLVKVDSKPKQFKSSKKYINIANSCKINRKLTTHQPISSKHLRKRTGFKDRIIHGFPDFMNRLSKYITSNSNDNNDINIKNLQTFNNIKLLSIANSPKNVLNESPNLFWQIPYKKNTPIFFTIDLPKPFNLHEIGINHSLNNFKNDLNMNKRWMSSAPKNIEILLHYSGNDSSLKKIFSKYFNQDFKKRLSLGNSNLDLTNWVRMGNLTYDIHSRNGYQSTNWGPDLLNELQNWEFDQVMLVIYDNHGDSLLVIDSVRIFTEVDRVLEQ